MANHVLVTGSSGQVGSYLVDHFRAEGRDTTGIDLRPSPWTHIVQDVRSPFATQADAIVHCAAQVSVARSTAEPRLDAANNIDGTLAMLDVARRQDCRRFVYFSSAAVYGVPHSLPIGEDHPTRPTSPYGLSKLAGEQYALMYGRLYGLPVTVVRPFNIYSARSDAGNPYSGVIVNFIGRIKSGSAPHIDGDGSQTRDFVHVSDVVQAVALILEDPRAVDKTFNVGTGRRTSIRELGELVVAASGRAPHPTHGPSRTGDIHDSVADIQALHSLGYAPRTALADGIRSLLADRVSA
jgi:UDP-glucose 4-epimerase